LVSVAFAVAPGDFFDSHDPTAATVDAPHGVEKEDEKSPQGNALKAPFGELVIARRRQMAARADCGRTLSRSYGHFDALFVGTEVCALINKTPKTMAAV
jgi:hypothetical protein